MAADLEVSSVIPTMVSTRRLEGTLVAPDVKQALPNHLTDTSKQNAMLPSYPNLVHHKQNRLEVCQNYATLLF